MRYFEDGDLTVGIKVAPEPYPIELIRGDWHIVWAHVDGNQRTTNYDESGALLAMGITVSVIEPQDKRKKLATENLQVDLNFCQWGLEYQGHYNTVGPATKMTLTENTTPKIVDGDDDAVLCFGAVRDDQDFPFLCFGTSVLPLDGRLKLYQNMEFVAKKTDDTGVHTLELTRNERLRLGFKMNDEGIFEDFLSGAKGNTTSSESYESLIRQCKEHTEARDITLRKLSALRAKMDQEMLEVGVAAGGHIPKTTGGAVKRTASGTLKSTPNSGGRRRRQSAKPHELHPPANTNKLLITPSEEDDPYEVPSEAPDFEDVASLPSSPESDSSSPKTKMRECVACKTSVTRHNWGVHVNTLKHRANVAPDGKAAPRKGAVGVKRRKSMGGSAKFGGGLMGETTPGRSKKVGNIAASRGAATQEAPSSV